MKILQLLGKRVLVRLAKGTAVTESGLIIPNGTERKRGIGTVEAIGPCCSMVSIGDRVMFSERKGVRIGKWDIIVEEEDVGMVIET